MLGDKNCTKEEEVKQDYYGDVWPKKKTFRLRRRKIFQARRKHLSNVVFFFFVSYEAALRRGNNLYLTRNSLNS